MPSDEVTSDNGDRGDSRRAVFELLPPAILVGACAGVLGGVFRLALRAAIEMRRDFVGAAVAAGLPAWIVGPLISAPGVVFAVWLVRRFAQEAAGSGIQEIEGALGGERPVRWARVLPVKFAGGVTAIGSGMIAGREGPTVQMGGAVGEMIAEGFKLDASRTRALLAAGAGAGLAAAFNTPLAGILFVIEEMRPHFRGSTASVTALIAACLVSDIAVRIIIGGAPDISIVAQPTPAIAALWIFVAMGAAFGLLGPLFNGAVMKLLDALAAFPRPLVVALAVGGTIGFLEWYEPDFAGEGYAVLERALHGSISVEMLLVVFVARFIGTVVCFCTGSPGGIFAPMLAVGTVFGVWFGETLGAFSPALGIDVQVFAVAGMGALFASVVGAPLTGAALAVGLTGNFSLFLPLIATCLTAALVSSALGGRPIYSLLLERTLAHESADG